MPLQAKPLPPAADLWERYSYNPLTGELFSLTTLSATPIGRPDKAGYLRINMHGLPGKVLLHRLIWKWVTGQEPANTIDHRNRNRSDNSFWNLRIATWKEQMENRDSSKCGPRKITAEQAQEIRARLDRGELQRVIAADYGISRARVGDIKTGRGWSINLG